MYRVCLHVVHNVQRVRSSEETIPNWDRAAPFCRIVTVEAIVEHQAIANARVSRPVEELERFLQRYNIN